MLCTRGRLLYVFVNTYLSGYDDTTIETKQQHISDEYNTTGILESIQVESVVGVTRGSVTHAL